MEIYCCLLREMAANRLLKKPLQFLPINQRIGLWYQLKFAARIFCHPGSWEYVGVFVVCQTKNPNISVEVFVVWGGIEPPTQGFSVLCSTN
ncbi:MAG: hypothetical protein JWP81_4458 [Ferruginibacter sp.]|nr:hypothetical protein [Ferruginibacter sp.]